ncbi:MAG: hypothetical protein ACOZQL_21950 [Myxococcota bacterium]
MKAGEQMTSEEPSVVGVRVRPAWSVALYAVLVASAGLALYAQRAPNVDPLIARVAPWLFLVFAVGFAVYRVALVVARRYSPFKAFIQILLATLFFLLLLFPRVQQQTAGFEGSLLGHGDARVRALAAEVAGWRGELPRAPALVSLLGDQSAEVRDAAHAALVKLNGGVDLGPATDEAARKAWGARFP